MTKSGSPIVYTKPVSEARITACTPAVEPSLRRMLET
jgi:hypothetical protein